MSRLIHNEHEIGDTVYLKTDKEQIPRMVYSFRVFRSETLYELACGTITSVHYDFEISTEKDVTINAL